MSSIASIVQTLEALLVAIFGGSLTINGTVTQFQGAVPKFWQWLTTDTVLPFFLLSVCISLTLLAVRIVRGIFYGV